MADDATVAAPEARIFVGMGGSGIKTLAKFAEMLTQHREEAAHSELFTAFLLVDTNGDDLRNFDRQIRNAYAYIHRDPIISTVHLSADITDFSSFVANKLQKAGHHERLQDAWWYRTDRKDEPFTALQLRGSPTRGAGQCPLVSTFLAWNQLPEIERAIAGLLDSLQNRSALGANIQNWSLDVSIVAGLAGGTGRGCWHLVASKVREALRNLNRRPKPVGYFFDATVFQNDVMNRDAVEAMKLRVNSITGVSELIGWLRNEYVRNNDIPPVSFRLPSLERPEDTAADWIDTARLTTNVRGESLTATSGRAPLSEAFVVFASGKQGSLGDATNYYQAVANALYARLFGTIAGSVVNEGGGFGGLGAATISVPITGIKRYVHEYIRQFLPRQYAKSTDPATLKQVVDGVVAWLEIPSIIPKKGDVAATNVPQRIYYAVRSRLASQLKNLDEQLASRDYEDAEETCKHLANWSETPDGKSSAIEAVKHEVATRLWGHQSSPDVPCSDGLLRSLGVADRLEHDEFFAIYGGNQKIARSNALAEGLRRVLQRSEIIIRTGAAGSEELKKYAIDGYGAKYAIASAIVVRLREIADGLISAMPDAVAQGQSGSESPLAVFERARSGLLTSGVTEKERRDILMAAEAWIVAKATKHVRESLRQIILEAVENTQAIALALSTTMESLNQAANRMEQDIQRSRDNHFWNEQDFADILAPSSPVFRKKMLSIQELQAVADDDDLEAELHRLMRDNSLQGFVEQRTLFERKMQSWVDANSNPDQKSIKTHTERLKDDISDGISLMADQFMLPPDFYERSFGFFVTVKKLIGKWGETMLQRAGSPQDFAKLKQAFKLQFGPDYPESTGGQPKQLTEEELDKFAKVVCTTMAIQLGGRCDPLFTQRFDEGEGSRFDRVTVVLPTEQVFDDKFREAVDAEATKNPQFSRAGLFQACTTFQKFDGGNPFNMIAYATQQFQDWGNDTGIDRIASLGYYQDADTIRWLKACEDPSGASVFLDDKRFELPNAQLTFGLGFISPLFVRDPHLKERRWSPWDDSKARSANKRSDRLDLAVYAILDEPPVPKAKLITAVHRKADWHLPLLSFDSKGEDASVPAWHFTRPAVRKCTEVLATKEREANHPAFGAGQGYASIRKCLDDLLDNNEIATAIAGEASLYMSEVLCNKEFEDDFDSTSDFRLMLDYLTNDRLPAAKKELTGPSAERMQGLIDELLDRVAKLREMTPGQLRDHYEMLRKNCELHSRA
jgi:hypothetical protein